MIKKSLLTLAILSTCISTVFAADWVQVSHINM